MGHRLGNTSSRDRHEVSGIARADTKNTLRLFGRWALAWRLLLGVGIVVLICALAFSRGQSEWLVLSAVRGFELASAAVIVVMLLFARYYSLSLRLLPRALAVGFFLYSSFYVIDYSLLEHTVQP